MLISLNVMQLPTPREVAAFTIGVAVTTAVIKAGSGRITAELGLFLSSLPREDSLPLVSALSIGMGLMIGIFICVASMAAVHTHFMGQNPVQPSYQ